MKIATIYFCLPLVAFALTHGAFAQETNMAAQHAHVHGHWHMYAALDDDRLTITLNGPAVDIIGFEHVPQTQAERDAVHAASETLMTQEVVRLTKSAKCKPAAMPEILLPESSDKEGFDKDEHSDDADDVAHASHHETAADGADDIDADLHDDEDRHDHHHHEAEIEIVYVFSCPATQKLARIEQRLFDYYPAIEEIEAVFLSESKQLVQALTRSSPDLRLK